MLRAHGASAASMFLQAFLVQSVSHFAMMGLIFWLVRGLGRHWLASRRIPPPRPLTRGQLWGELRYSASSLAIGTASAIAVSLLYASGHTRLTSDLSRIGWPAAMAGLLAFLAFNDLWFYGWHRLLHHPRLFRHIHGVHHRSVDVNPFSVYAFHPLEALILGSAVIPFVMIVPLYLPVLGVAQIVGLLNNVMSHLGYELLPRWFQRIPPFKYMNTATYHALHHARFRGNYGLLFRIWDRWLGTELPGYEHAFEERGERHTVAPQPSPRA